MKKKYCHLTSDNRMVIKTLLQENKSYSYIAERVGVHRSTIYREVHRNSGLKGYRFKQAHRKALERKLQPRFKKLDVFVVRYIIGKILDDYSPEQIAGVIFKDIGISVSPETIYKLVISDKHAGGCLFRHLRINGKRKRKKRVGTPEAMGQIKNKISIEERSKIVDTRSRFGDWEADLVSGAKHKGFLVTLLERNSGFVRIGHVRHKESYLVKAEIIRLLAEYRVKTITFDNGKEFAGHDSIAKSFSCKCYFCHSYSSYERGSNENTNGLIRQYLPKGLELLEVPISRLREVEQRLNSRPRKRHGYKSPEAILK